MERTTTFTAGDAQLNDHWADATNGTTFPRHLRQLETILENAGLLSSPEAFKITNGTGIGTRPHTYTSIDLSGGKTILAFNFKPEHIFVFPVMRSVDDTDPQMVAQLQNLSPEDMRNQIVSLLANHQTPGAGQPCTADNHPDFIKRGISVIEIGNRGVLWPVRLREDLGVGLDTPTAEAALSEHAPV